jgi:hypothetical protein
MRIAVLIVVTTVLPAVASAQSELPDSRRPAPVRDFGQTLPEDDKEDDAVWLHVAAKLGLITGAISGLGQSSGEALEFRIRRLKRERLQLALQPGTIFGPKRASTQRMVGLSIVGGPIVLEDDEWHTFTIEAYCLDFHKGNPSKFDRFTMDEVSEEYAKLLKAAKGSLTTRTLQTALWIYVDPDDAEEIPSHFSVSDRDVSIAEQFLRNYREGRIADAEPRRFPMERINSLSGGSTSNPRADAAPAAPPKPTQGFNGPARPFGGPNRGFGNPR